MHSFLTLLRHEMKLFRTAVIFHLVALLQPTLMYLLMGSILVTPTFDMFLQQPTREPEAALVEAMSNVGSPIGDPYIRVRILNEEPRGEDLRQWITFREEGDLTVVTQHYGLIDSNLVKNYRNRLTAAALRVWNGELGKWAVEIEEHPRLPRDVPFTVFFGMAMLPLAVSVSVTIPGGMLSAREFEDGTILEQRAAPLPIVTILGARFAKLVLLGWLGGGLMVAAVGGLTGYWPGAPVRTAVVLLLVSVIMGCVGMCGGWITRKTIPSFIIALVVSFVTWLLGSAFGLAAGFGKGYGLISRLTPNTHAVELIFPAYFPADIGRPLHSWMVLVGLSALSMLGAGVVYRLRVRRMR